MEHGLIPLREARQRLGVSKAKMAALVRQDLFPVYANPLDKREKLVNWKEVQAALKRPQPLHQDSDQKKAAA
jgi:hypothetical protein